MPSEKKFSNFANLSEAVDAQGCFGDHESSFLSLQDDSHKNESDGMRIAIASARRKRLHFGVIDGEELISKNSFEMLSIQFFVRKILKIIDFDEEETTHSEIV